jgi:hypothetical protein
MVRALLKNYRQKRIAFPIFDQSSSIIFAPYFLDGNALRFLYCTHEIRKPKTRNASRFRRLTLVLQSKINCCTIDFFLPRFTGGRLDF